MPVEERALIAGLRREPLSQDRPLDWNRLDQLARAHGVICLIHASWQDCPDVPPPLLRFYGEVRRQVGLASTVALWQRDEVLEILRGAGVPCLVLKGAALARSWYGDLSLRPICDIDLLVAERDLERAERALWEVNYRPTTATVAGAHHVAPLRHPELLCPVELHRRITALPVGHAPTLEDVLPRTIQLSGEDIGVRTLGPEDTLISLCLHLLGHARAQGGWNLRLVVDIARQIEIVPLHWDRFDALAEEAGVTRGCRAVLGLTEHVMGIAIPGSRADLVAGLELLVLPLTPRGRLNYRRLEPLLALRASGRPARASTLASLGWRALVPAHDSNIQPVSVSRLIHVALDLMAHGPKTPGALQREIRIALCHARVRQQAEQLVGRWVECAVTGS